MTEQKDNQGNSNHETHLLPRLAFARKVRIAAIKTGLIDKIEFTAATVAPGQPNEEYSKITPLKKLPVLILDNGDVILDSYVSSNISTSSPAAES